MNFRRDGEVMRDLKCWPGCGSAFPGTANLDFANGGVGGSGGGGVEE